MRSNSNDRPRLDEPPRRLTRKQSQKWINSGSVPKCLRHAGRSYIALREAASESRAFNPANTTRH